jgi:MtrB/PioB family decaheme-associated outer membrane protein
VTTRRSCAIALLAAALRAAPLLAQPPQEPPFRFGRIDIGVQGVDLDQDSSAFREYRALPKGFAVPYLRALGRGRVPYDLRVHNGGRDDGRYLLSFEPGSFTIAASYLRIPHRFTNGALSILSPDGNTLQAPAGVQARNQAALERQLASNRNGIDASLLANLASASLPGGQLLDVKLLRERGRIDVSLARSRDFDARVSYAFDKRDGSRVAGASFGYQNVVEIAEPIHYQTDDFTAQAEWKVRFGLVRGSLGYSRFTNQLQSVTFQNPFRATDSTELNAMFGPSPFGVDGPREGRIALPPDNQAVRGSLGFLAKLPGRSRFNADFSIGRWKQNEPFIPFSSNGAITTPVRAADAAALPARSLNGEMQTVTQSYTFSSRPLSGLVFTARYRNYKLSNDTPRLTVPGEAYFDGVWNFNSRVSVPYAYTKDRLFAASAYEWGRASFEAGFSYEGWDRAFRETRRTTEGLFHLKADVRPRDWVLARALVQWGARDYDLYLPRAGESSSYPNGKPPTLLSELRRPDQAKRDSTRYGGELLLTPGNASVMLSYLKGTLDYYATLYGEQKAGSEVLSAEADYTPLERVNLFAYATRENLTSLVQGAQRGQAGAPNPVTEWRSDMRDRATSFGLGGSFAVVKDKADLRIQAGYQKVDGNNDLTATAGAVDIAGFDDTRIRSLSGEFGYKPRPHWTVALGGFVEDFEFADSTRSGLPTYVPGGFFLVGNFGDYNAKVFYLKLSYNW